MSFAKIIQLVFFIQSDNFCPLMGIFNSFTLNVITDLFKFKSAKILCITLVPQFLCLFLSLMLFETSIMILFYFIIIIFFRATVAAYGSSQARGQIGAAADGLRHSRSNTGSEP